MNADVRVVSDKLSKMMNNGWGRERDEWRVESMRAYDALKSCTQALEVTCYSRTALERKQ